MKTPASQYSLTQAAGRTGSIGGKMKTFGMIAAGLLIPIVAMADAITSPGASFVSVPLNFQATTGSNGGMSAPFWNNKSMDGTNMNGGDFLTGSNVNMGLTNYLSSGAGFGNYLSTGSSGLDAPTNFNFVQAGLTVDVTLLYTNAAANIEYSWLHLPGTEIGFYNVQNPSQKEVVFAHGTLNNPLGGIYNNDVSPQTPFSIGTFADYGVYATTCQYTGTVQCNTVYSNSALNPAGETNHEHFALFQQAQEPQTYFLAFEDAWGISPTEGYGDFNDAIFRLVTDDPILPNTPTNPVPEPATFSILGLGLMGLGLMRRRASAPTN